MLYSILKRCAASPSPRESSQSAPGQVRRLLEPAVIHTHTHTHTPHSQSRRAGTHTDNYSVSHGGVDSINGITRLQRTSVFYQRYISCPKLTFDVTLCVEAWTHQARAGDLEIEICALSRARGCVPCARGWMVLHSGPATDPTFHLRPDPGDLYLF